MARGKASVAVLLSLAAGAAAQTLSPIPSYVSPVTTAAQPACSDALHIFNGPSFVDTPLVGQPTWTPTQTGTIYAAGNGLYFGGNGYLTYNQNFTTSEASVTLRVASNLDSAGNQELLQMKKGNNVISLMVYNDVFSVTVQ